MRIMIKMHSTNSVHKGFTLAIVTLLLAACDGKGSFSNYSNYDLKTEFSDCKSSNLSPSAAQRCLNIEKECKRRREESGFRC